MNLTPTTPWPWKTPRRRFKQLTGAGYVDQHQCYVVAHLAQAAERYARGDSPIPFAVAELLRVYLGIKPDILHAPRPGAA